MLIAGTKVHLIACKDKDYQEGILTMYRALAAFLTFRGFTTEDLADRFSESPESFELHADDLTESGLNWVKKNLDRWMGNMDRRKKPITYNAYIDALEKTIK